MIPGLSLVVLLTSPALIQEESGPAEQPERVLLFIQEPEEGAENERPVRIRLRQLPGRAGELIEQDVQEVPGDTGRRTNLERRAAAAERLLAQARQELEAGRPERARGMIRAARALLGSGPIGANVRQRAMRRAEVRLDTDDDDDAPDQADAPGRGTIRIEIKTVVRREDGTEDETVQVKEIQLGEHGIVIKDEDDGDDDAEGQPARSDDDADDDDDEMDEQPGQARTEGNDEAATDEAQSEGGEPSLEEQRPVGVGFLLEIENGAYVVRRVLPGSPAESEGSIQVGDTLVGIVDSDGNRQVFQDKPLEEIIPMIRGEVGSKVTLVVQSGSDEPREVELERQPLTPPDEDAPGDDTDEDDDDDDNDADDEDDDSDG